MKNILFAAILVIPTTSFAQSSCSASNEEGDECSISCPVGQAAQCDNTTAGNKPICKCEASEALRLLPQRLDGATQEIFGSALRAYDAERAKGKCEVEVDEEGTSGKCSVEWEF